MLPLHLATRTGSTPADACSACGRPLPSGQPTAFCDGQILHVRCWATAPRNAAWRGASAVSPGSPADSRGSRDGAADAREASGPASPGDRPSENGASGMAAG